MISTVDESDFEDEELKECFNDDEDCDNDFFAWGYFKSLINILEHKVDFTNSCICEENPVQETNVEGTQDDAEYVNRYRVSIKTYDLNDCAVNIYVMMNFTDCFHCKSDSNRQTET